eukprot:SAG22_NODE_12495_length_440_cov_1.492669_2_plen_86_part_00
MFERPSIKGNKQHAYNFNPEIGLPVLSFEEMRPFIDPKMWDVIPPDPEKELRKQSTFCAFFSQMFLFYIVYNNVKRSRPPTQIKI